MQDVGCLWVYAAYDLIVDFYQVSIHLSLYLVQEHWGWDWPQIAQNINKVDILTILEMPYIGELHSYTLHGTQSFYK